MAACCSWKTIPISSSSARALLHRSSSSPSASHFVWNPTMSVGLPSAKAPASSRFSVQRPTNFRLPVELSSMQSLMPLCSVTASSLSTSLLSFHNKSWGCLSKAMPEEKEILNRDFNSKMLLKGLSYTELEKWVQAQGYRPGQALMLWKRLYGDNIWAHTGDELEGLNKDFKKMLIENAEFRALSLREILPSCDGTRKDITDFVQSGRWPDNRNCCYTLR